MTEGPDEENRELRAARWEPDAGIPTFRRPFPWHWAGLALVLVVGIGLYAKHSRETKLDALEARLVREHTTQVRSHAGEIDRFRQSVEGMVVRAARMPEPSSLEPGFTVESLRGRPGVYIRIRERDTASAAAIGEALSSMEPDAIPRCLGITPVAMRTLYTKSELLKPEWLLRARGSRDTIRLRVRIDEVERFARRDLPVLRSIVESEYVLVSVVRGDTRETSAVDAYVFDARSGALRLATRTRAEGVLITGRISGYRAPTPSAAALAMSGAMDCSIASQIRTRTGEFGAATASSASSPSPTPLDAGVELQH